MAELQRELHDERNREELKKIGQTSGVLTTDDSKKLEWMYKGSQELVNREEYLLGRTVDKTFEQLDAIEKEQQGNVTIPKNHVEHECIPFSIRSFRGGQTTNEQVDLTRKLMEDPVMAIKQKEMESRRKILENPVKLKELHRLLKQEDGSVAGLVSTSSSGRTKEKKYKNKKDKKSKSNKKKKKRSYSTDSNDSTDSCKVVDNTRNKRKINHSRSNSCGSSKNSDEQQSHNRRDDDDLDKILTRKYKKIQSVINNDDDDDDEKNMDLNKLLSLKYNKLTEELDKISKKHKKGYSAANDDDDRGRSRSPDNKSTSRSRSEDRDHRNIRRSDSSDRVRGGGDRVGGRQRYNIRSPDFNKKNNRNMNRWNPNQRNFNSRGGGGGNYRVNYNNQGRNQNNYNNRGGGGYNQRGSGNFRGNFSNRMNYKNSRYRDNNECQKQTHYNNRHHDQVQRRGGDRSRSRSYGRNNSQRYSRNKYSDRRGGDGSGNDRQKDMDRHRSPSQANRNRSRSHSITTHRNGSKQRSVSRDSDRGVTRKHRNRSRSSSRTRSRSKTSARNSVSSAEEFSRKQQSRSRTRRISSDDDRSVQGEDKYGRKFGLVTADGKKLLIKKRTSKERERMRPTKAVKKSWQRPEKQRLTGDEVEKKRQEMLLNAEWRDGERERNVKRYQDEDLKDKEKFESSSFDHNFITKELNKATRNETVESRIKSNINNIQRSGQAMDMNFARR